MTLEATRQLNDFKDEWEQDEKTRKRNEEFEQSQGFVGPVGSPNWKPRPVNHTRR